MLLSAECSAQKTHILSLNEKLKIKKDTVVLVLIVDRVGATTVVASSGLQRNVVYLG
jgi:hypothetical protein